MSEVLDQNPALSEETVQETPAELSKEEIWAKILDPDAKKQEAPTDSEPKVEEIEATPVEEPEKPEPEPEKPADPLANDPTLVKRFRDSQDFIATLKEENKELRDRVDSLAKDVEKLNTPAKTPDPPTTKVDQAQANEVFQDILDSLPDNVREEVTTFPELFKGIDALIKHRLSSANKEFEQDIQTLRKSNHERHVQQRLNERHQAANSQLGITNSAQLDLDDPVFAQWVLSNKHRKNVVLDFDNPASFVDLVRSFLFDYPDKGVRPQTVEEPKPEPLPENPKRKAASHSIPSRPVVRNREPKRIQTEDDKLAFWNKLISENRS